MISLYAGLSDPLAHEETSCRPVEAGPFGEFEGLTTRNGVETGYLVTGQRVHGASCHPGDIQGQPGIDLPDVLSFHDGELFSPFEPFVLGLAIDGLLKGSYVALGWFAAQHLGHLVIGVARRAYDTRMFGRIHADLVTQLVLEQRRREVEVTRVVARSGLSREFVEFFERQIPVLIQTVFLIIGGLAILATYDGALVLLCAALIRPRVCAERSFRACAYLRRAADCTTPSSAKWT